MAGKSRWRRKVNELRTYRWRQLRWAARMVTGSGTLHRWRQTVTFLDPASPPPAPREVGSPPAVHLVPGAIHVHTVYSDGLGNVPEVAEAGARAGLKFIIVSDHDTLKGLIEGWEGYHAGCLVLIGAELRVMEGHILAMGLPADFRVRRMFPVEETLERVRSAGGFAFVLPDEIARFSGHQLERLPFAGMEVVSLHNLAMQAASLPHLPAFAARYLRRGPLAALSGMISRPDGDLAAWDRRAVAGAPVGIASVDAHSRFRILDWEVRLPTYQQAFELVQTHLLLPAPLTGQTGSDRQAVYDALRAGRAHLVFQGGPEAAQVRFWAQAGDRRAGVGEELEASADLVFHATSPRPGTLFRLYRDGERIAQQEGCHARFVPPGPGVYRLETYRRRGRVGRFVFGVTPWVFTNPIRIVAVGALGFAGASPHLLSSTSATPSESEVLHAR